MTAPDFLSDAAKAEWKRAAKDLGGSCDWIALAAYCQAWSRWQDAEKLLDENGTEVIIRNDKGEVKTVITSPQVAIAAKASAQMLKLWAALSRRRKV